MIFCREECYRQSSLPEKWEAVCAISRFSPKQLLTRIRKKKYRASEKGREQHRQESKRHYAKKKAARILAKHQEDAVHPNPETATSPPEKSDADALLDAIISEPVVMPAVTPDTTETVSLSPLVIPAVNALRQTKHRAILKILFSGQPEPAILSSEEAIAVPAGVIPGVCKALGCNAVVVPRSTKTEKRFCSKICRNALRNTFQNLKEAWRATRCRFLKLLGMLFKQL
jgi:hypothetical protein